MAESIRLSKYARFFFGQRQLTDWKLDMSLKRHKKYPEIRECHNDEPLHYKRQDLSFFKEQNKPPTTNYIELLRFFSIPFLVLLHLVHAVVSSKCRLGSADVKVQIKKLSGQRFTLSKAPKSQSEVQNYRKIRGNNMSIVETEQSGPTENFLLFHICSIHLCDISTPK